MGQRHQAFAIAKVVPHGGARAYYRCIAAWHHQWCYGRLPLHAANRFCQLLRQKDNASIVVHELAAINGKYGRHGEQPKIVQVPCVYTSWLLGQAWDIDLDIAAQGQPYFSGTSFQNALLPASMSSGGGDNNDGITVIDVTDPANPSYCFVAPGSIEADEEIDSWVPLSAEQYARAYYPAGKGNPRVEEDVLATIARLDGTPILSINALAEAWPHEYEAEGKPVETGDDPTASVIPSLSSLTIDAAISSDQTAGLEDLVWMPDKAALITARLRSAAEIPDSAVSVLAEAIKPDVQAGDARVDLSTYALTPGQTLACLSNIEGTIYSIKVPKTFTIDTLRELLAVRPDLRRIDLLATDILSVDLAKLLHTEPKLFYQVESLIHSPLTLYPGPYKNYVDEYFPAFTFVHLTNSNIMSGGGFPGASLPLLYPPQIVQNLADYLGIFTTDDFMRDTSVAGKDLIPHVVMGAASRPEGVSWHQRHVNSHPKASARGLEGHGWLFVLSISSPFHGDSGSGFLGFAKLSLQQNNEAEGETEHKDAAVKGEVLGLKEWLAVMKGEGRPMPAESAVQKLQEIIDAIVQRPSMHAMTSDDITSMMESARREAMMSSMYNRG